MIKLPENIRLKFYEIIFDATNLNEFEAWIYIDKQLESALSPDDYLELISFNYKKNGAKYELVELLFNRFINPEEYQKWKMLNLLYTALQKDERLPDILRQFYDLYCKGYTFLNDLGLGYGLTVEVPPSKFPSDNWADLSDENKVEILQSFHPQLESDIQRAIAWIEQGKIIFKRTKNEMGNQEYDDLRTDEEAKSTVWTVIESNPSTSWEVRESNLKIIQADNQIKTAHNSYTGRNFISKLFSKFRKYWS